MQAFLVPYAGALWGMLAMGLLLVLQYAIGDAMAIRARHVPGTPLTGGHESFVFRSGRARDNTIENLPLFVLAVLLCVLSSANPRWTGIWTAVFVAARLAHMLCYYADLRSARSGFFVLGMVAQVGLLATAAIALGVG